MSGPNLYAAPPWREHRFPHRRITRKVCTARLEYRCDKVGAKPPGHTPSIDAGELYLRVALRPPKGGAPGRWTTVRLCRACAIHYGLGLPSRPAELTK